MTASNSPTAPDSHSAPHPVPRAIIFDFGKVLSELPDVDAHTALVATAGVPDEVFEQHYWAHRHDYDAGALNGQSYWQKVAHGAGFDLTAERLTAFHHHDSLMWANLNAPMLAWAAALQAAGIKTAILSNMGEVNLAYMRKNFDWLSGFTHLTWSCELGVVKPDPAIYLHTVKKLNVSPDRALFIDNLQKNIVGAEAVGLHAALFESPEQLQNYLARRGFPLPPLESNEG